jgi:hypothetical protein
MGPELLLRIRPMPGAACQAEEEMPGSGISPLPTNLPSEVCLQPLNQYVMKKRRRVGAKSAEKKVLEKL